MKSTGIIRSLDKMGRIVIPKEYRNQLNMKNAEDSFEIFMEDDKIVLKKYQPTCIFCNGEENLIEFGDRTVCEECIEKMDTISKEKKINEEGSNSNV